MTSESEAVEFHGLTKVFGNNVAVDNVDLFVYEGEVFGLLGPNGAGKTTTIRMVCTLLKPTSGKAKVFGFDIVKEPLNTRSFIGLLPQEGDVYEQLTGWENVAYFAKLCHLSGAKLREAVDDALKVVGLRGRAAERAGTYSGGMKRRLMIARAIVHRPRLLILDEPTIGLDIFSARRVRDLIRSVAKEPGRTVIVCTNDLDEAERLCDRVAIMDRGKVVAIGGSAELKERFNEPSLEALLARLTIGEEES